MPVVQESHDALSGTVESLTGTQEKVRIRIEQLTPKIPNDPPRTEVGVRVATFGDQEVSNRVLLQVGYRLGAVR
jgi:hypothetical protein